MIVPSRPCPVPDFDRKIVIVPSRVLSRILAGCPGQSCPTARFWACPVVPLSRDNEGTSVMLSLCPGTTKRLMSLCPGRQENLVPLETLVWNVILQAISLSWIRPLWWCWWRSWDQSKHFIYFLIIRRTLTARWRVIKRPQPALETKELKTFFMA